VTREQYAREWLQYGEKDLVAARFLFGMKPLPPEIICFHCQQAAEKALKAYLAYHGTNVPKTHDLTNLNELCASYEKDLESLVEQCIALNDYAVEMRYPSKSRIEEGDAHQALKDAEIVLNKIRERLKHE
jgi:HEPN domain-containing protein